MATACCFVISISRVNPSSTGKNSKDFALIDCCVKPGCTSPQTARQDTAVTRHCTAPLSCPVLYCIVLLVGKLACVMQVSFTLPEGGNVDPDRPRARGFPLKSPRRGSPSNGHLRSALVVTKQLFSNLTAATRYFTRSIQAFVDA